MQQENNLGNLFQKNIATFKKTEKVAITLWDISQGFSSCIHRLYPCFFVYFVLEYCNVGKE